MSKNYEPDARYRYRRDSYTKGEIDTLLDEKVDIDDVYTKAEADALLDLKADQSDTYTKADVDALVEDAGGEKQVVTINNTSYVISESDKGKWLRFTSSNPVFVVWPIEAEFSPGNEVELFRVGDGPVTVFSEWAQDVRFNGKDDFRLNAKFSQVRAVNGDVNEWDCTYSGDVVFGVYQSPYYISDPGSDPSPIPWTPAEITTALWLDASDLATITEASGSVSQWDDKSGNARHAVGTGHAPQTGAATINSLNVMSFNGTSQYFDLPGLSAISGGASVFAVLKIAVDPPTVVAKSLLWFIGSNSLPAASEITHYPFVDGNIYDAFATSSRKSTGNPADDLSQPHIYAVKSINGEWTSRINGSQHFTTASNTFVLNTTGSTFGYRLNSSVNYYFNGVLAEIIILEGNPSSSVRDEVEGYMAWKWGIESSLPALHPYKSAPPTV